MPVIKIREKIEEVNSPVTGQSNAVVVPLFINSQRIVDGKFTEGGTSCELYSTVSEFKSGLGSMVIKEVAYTNYGSANQKVMSETILDKSYYIIEELLRAGSKVYVYPIDLVDDDVVNLIINENDGLLTEILISGDRETLGAILSYATGKDLVGNQNYVVVVDTILDDKTETRAVQWVPADTTYSPKDYLLSLDGGANKNNILFTKYRGAEDIVYSEIIRILAENGYFNKLKDKMAYNFKFLTTGAHANAYYVRYYDEDDGNLEKLKIDGAYKYLLPLCVALEDDATLKSGRGDCLFTLDFSSDLTKTPKTYELEDPDEGIYSVVTKDIYTAMCDISLADISLASSPEMAEAYGKFGFCTYPWVKKNISSGTAELPGSFAYLMAFMASTITKGNEDFAAIAGYRRGAVSDGNDLVPVEDLGDIDCHVFQSDSFSEFDYGSGDNKKYFNITINPIIKYQDGTYRIKGNRVVSKPPIGIDGINPDADNVRDCTYFLNVRHIIFDIKKECYMASDREQFEPNDDVTWTNFLNWVNPLLNEMVNNRGLDWYSWKRLDTNGVKGLIKAQVTVKPIEAVESFDITVFVKNTDEEE